MRAAFPFNKNFKMCYLSIKDWYYADCEFSDENNVTKRLHLCFDIKQVCIIRDGASTESGSKIERDAEIQELFDVFFEWTGGEVDVLGINCNLEGDAPVKRNDEIVNRISKILAGRPIKTTLLRQATYPSRDLNSPLNEYFRDYIEFQMYGTKYDIGAAAPLAISDKMVKCDFLYLHVLLANSEVLKDFKGLGLVIRIPDPRFNFDYLKDVFQKWYSGEEIQWKYLCFPCEVSSDECDFIKPLGKVFEMQIREKIIKEYEITRPDGEICHLGGLPFAEENVKCDDTPHLMYFYIGECSEEIFYFNYFHNSLTF